MTPTPPQDPTRPLAARDLGLLAECDRVSAYASGGWYRVSGWIGEARLVHGHAHSRADLVRTAAEMGFRWTDDGPVPLRPEERAGAGAYRQRHARPR